jgi:hypothetical protein
MPGHEERMAVWDHLPAAQAVARAWQPPDPRRFGRWHALAREEVADLMPLLARALDRLLVELDDVLPSTDWRLWESPEPEVDPREVVRTDRIKRQGRYVGRGR